MGLSRKPKHWADSKQQIALCKRHLYVLDQNGLYGTSAGMQTFMNELGSYACCFDDSQKVDEKLDVYTNLDILGNVAFFVVLRDSSNTPRINMTSSVLLCQSQQIKTRAPYNLSNVQRERLSVTILEKGIEYIEGEFPRFWKEPLHLVALAESQFEKIESSQNSFAYPYSRLHKFVRELSIGSTGTATVESDLFFINYEDRTQRHMLSSLALAGILHPRQWEQVRRITLS